MTAAELLPESATQNHKPDFRLDSVQSDLVVEFRHFGQRILRPNALEADRIAGLPEGISQTPEVLNFMRVFVPRELGGGWRSLSRPDRIYDTARSALLRVLFCEESAYWDAALTIALPGPGLAEPVITALGSTEQKKKYLGIFLADGAKWGAFALSEPGSGSDVASISTTSVRTDDGYLINGTKWFVGNGPRADWIVVFASINPSAGQFGIRPFVIEKNTPGFKVGRVFPTLGLRAVQISELVFTDCQVSREQLLGPEKVRLNKSGFQGAMLTFDVMRPTVAAMGVAIGRAAIDQAEELVNQNGASHSLAHAWQQLRGNIGSTRVRLHAARLLARKAAWLRDMGFDNSLEASMAKSFGAQAGMAACTLALEAARIADPGQSALLDKLFRDVKAFDILEGTGEMQRLMMAKSLLRKSTSSSRDFGSS